MLTLELVIPLDVRTLVAVTADAVNALVLNEPLVTDDAMCMPLAVI